MSFFREHVVKRFRRASGWRKVRNAHLKKYPRCAVCNTKSSPEVHHKIPFKNRPDLELDPTNLITLCGKRCHFAFGHLFYWRAYNSDLIKTIVQIKGRITNRSF